MKVVLAECGGKSPHVVFDDGIDLEGAATFIAKMLITNQGQICSVGSRLLIQRSIQQSIVDLVSERFAGLMMGNALDPNTTFGPLASATQLARVKQYIEGATSDGIRLVRGGRQMLSDSGGFFVEPTIFDNVPPTSRIAREEIFGPVLSVIPFDDEADAIRLANSTAYGLAAYVWTSKLSTAMVVGKQIRSSVIVNSTVPKGEGPGHAFSQEPTGESGIGTEHGMAGMCSYLRRHLMWFNHA
jgi:acyl-CoA reductase-like NAD-dependent aldehyde dehydrogenase